MPTEVSVSPLACGAGPRGLRFSYGAALGTWFWGDAEHHGSRRLRAGWLVPELARSHAGSTPPSRSLTSQGPRPLPNITAPAPLLSLL